MTFGVPIVQKYSFGFKRLHENTGYKVILIISFLPPSLPSSFPLSLPLPLSLPSFFSFFFETESSYVLQTNS
jgi:hypothetical protein